VAVRFPTVDELFPARRDVHVLWEYYRTADPGHKEIMGRALVHAAHATIEGFLFVIETYALLLDARNDECGIEPRLTQAERLSLANKRVRLSDDGQASLKDLNPSLWARFNLATSALARLAGKRIARKSASGPSEILIIDAAGRDTVEKSRKIRNRLTHPRGSEYMSVAEGDVRTVIAAVGEIAFACTVLMALGKGAVADDGAPSVTGSITEGAACDPDGAEDPGGTCGIDEP
jgi:hypothetical protein